MREDYRRYKANARCPALEVGSLGTTGRRDGSSQFVRDTEKRISDTRVLPARIDAILQIIGLCKELYIGSLDLRSWIRKKSRVAKTSGRDSLTKPITYLPDVNL